MSEFVPAVSTGFEIVVPAPGDALKARIIHPDNARLKEELESYLPQLLDKKTLKNLLDTEKRLLVTLNTAGFMALEDVLNGYAMRYKEILAERAAIKDESQSAPPDMLPQLHDEFKELKKELDEIIEKANRAKIAMQPYRKQARQLRTVQQELARHRAAMARHEAYERSKAGLVQEARDFHDILQEALTGMGYCYRYHLNGKDRVQRVQFDEIWSGLDGHWFKVRTTSKGIFGWRWRLPRNLNPIDLIKDETTQALTVATERQVEAHAIEHNGIWYKVNRLGVTDGLVERVSFSQMVATYPSEIHHLIPIPLGIKSGLQPYWVGLTEYPHFLVAGASGSGKSNMTNLIISTIVTTQSPDDIRIIFVDMKNGQEFGIYQDANLPHAMGGTIRDPIAFWQLLSRLETMRDERTQAMSAVYARDIDDYNRLVPAAQKMPRILVMVDEFSRIYMSDPYMSDKENKNIAGKIKSLVRQLLALGRSVGIQILISTQTPYAEILPGIDKANISMKLCFRFLDKTTSRTVLGNGAAAEISDKFPGRGIIQTPGAMFMVQTPQVTNADREKAIAVARTWDKPLEIPMPQLPVEVRKASEGVTVDEIVDISLRLYDGSLSVYKLYQQWFKDRISRERLDEKIKDMRGKTYEHEGKIFRTKKGIGGGLVLEYVEDSQFPDSPLYEAS